MDGILSSKINLVNTRKTFNRSGTKIGMLNISSINVSSIKTAFIRTSRMRIAKDQGDIENICNVNKANINNRVFLV